MYCTMCEAVSKSVLFAHAHELNQIAVCSLLMILIESAALLALVEWMSSLGHMCTCEHRGQSGYMCLKSPVVHICSESRDHSKIDLMSYMHVEWHANAYLMASVDFQSFFSVWPSHSMARLFCTCCKCIS